MHAHSVGHNDGVASLADQAASTEILAGIVGGDIRREAAIQGFVLEEKNGVRRVDGPGKEAFGVFGEGRVSDHETGNMEEPRLVGLTVEWTGCDPRSSRHAHDHIRVLSPAPMELGQIVDDLVESAGHEVGELPLDQGLGPGSRGPEPATKDNFILAFY